MSWDLKFYKQQPRVATAIGDVMICQEFSNYEQDLGSGEKLKKMVNPDTNTKIKKEEKSVTNRHFSEKNKDNFYIRVGQALGSWMSNSTSNSEHAAIVTTAWSTSDEGSPNPLGRICDANVGDDDSGRTIRGIAIRIWRARPAYVYRCTQQDLSREASAVGSGLASKVRASLYGATTARIKGGEYDWDAAAHSVTKFKYVDAESTKFVDACYDIMYNVRGAPTHVPGMFCSGFAVVCYMVAAKRVFGDYGRLGNLNVDPRAISPKALQSLLERSDLFSRAGRCYCDGT